MNHRLLLLDIDGTLRPYSSPVIPPENVAAVTALQRIGVKVAIATGRPRAGIPDSILNGLVPDYWICTCGTQILDAENRELFSCRMSASAVEKLYSFCSEQGHPLICHYSDTRIMVCGRERYLSLTELPPGMAAIVYDPDSPRLTAEQPFSCFAWMPEADLESFLNRYPDPGVDFYFYHGRACDIIPSGVTKATGMDHLLAITGIPREESVFMGDSENDIALLRRAGSSWCMADGSPSAIAAAQHIAPPSDAFGVAAVCRELWPEAFTEENG